MVEVKAQKSPFFEGAFVKGSINEKIGRKAAIGASIVMYTALGALGYVATTFYIANTTGVVFTTALLFSVNPLNFGVCISVVLIAMVCFGIQRSIFDEVANPELKKYFELAHKVEWNENLPMFKADVAEDIVENGLPKDYPIPLKNRIIFIRFLTDLVNNKKLYDHYRNPISSENTKKLKMMVFAVLNKLNSNQDQDDIAHVYASVIDQISKGLNNCSNGINTNVEKVFYDITYPKGGNIAFRVKLSVQKYRETVFRKAILHCIKQSSRADYYLTHETATVSYYFGHMASLMGLPKSLCKDDRNYKGFALKGQEQNIIDYLNREFTEESIIQHIEKQIKDVYDPSIPTQFFTDWLRDQDAYKENPEKFFDEEFNFKREAIVFLLSEVFKD